MSNSAVASPAARRGLSAFIAILALVELSSGATQIYMRALLPTIALWWHVSVRALSWLVIAFGLSTTVTTPLFAKLGDVYGHRKVLTVEVALVTIGSLLVATAPSFGLILAGRLLQGMYAAYLPLMFGAVRSRYSHDDTRRSISYLTAVLLFAVLGSLIVVAMIARYAGSPTWAEWLPAGLALIGLVSLLVTRGQQAGMRPAQAREAAPRIDWAGFVLLAGGFALVLLGLSEGPTWGWSSGRVIGCLVAGVLALAAWAWVELHVAEPLADVRFLFRPAFLPVYATGFLLYLAALGVGRSSNATFSAAPGKLLGYGLGLNAFQLSMWGAFELGVRLRRGGLHAPAQPRHRDARRDGARRAVRDGWLHAAVDRPREPCGLRGVPRPRLHRHRVRRELHPRPRRRPVARRRGRDRRGHLRAGDHRGQRGRQPRCSPPSCPPTPRRSLACPPSAVTS